MNKHTPGPWKVSNYRPYDIIARDPKESTYECGDNRYDPIATVYRNHTQEFLANARLIAAAPELLEALKGVLEWDYDELDYDLRKRLESVVAKVEGAT